MKGHNFKDLEVWQLGRELSVKVYRLTSGFPRGEQFGLTLQVRKAAASVPLNISEGHGLRSDAGFSRHLKIALGSLNETETALIIAADLDFLPRERVEELQADCTRLAIKINNLLKSFPAIVRESLASYGADHLSSTYPQESST